MPKLNQIVAVVSGKKTGAMKALTELNKAVQKQDLFNGFVKTYHPSDEDGETFPTEQVKVRLTYKEVLNEVSNVLTDIMDAVATQDVGNQQAVANVIVKGVTVLENVPVTYLMYLEKQLVDLTTLVKNIPILDDAYEWKYNENALVFTTDEVRSNKTKKTIKPIELSPATDKHPAQVTTINEDVKVGEWATTKRSGAIPVVSKQTILQKIEELQEAVKFAREEANSIKVEQVQYAHKVFDFLFK